MWTEKKLQIRWCSGSEYIDHVYPGADTRYQYQHAWDLYPLHRALFLSCYGIRIFAAPGTFLMFVGWFTISEKKLCPSSESTLYKNISSNHVLFFVPAWYERTASGSKQLPLVLDASPLNLTIPLIKFVFSRSRNGSILLLPQYSPQLRYFFTPPRFVRGRCSSLTKSNRFRLIWPCAQFSFRTRMAKETTFPIPPLVMAFLVWATT